MTREAYERKKAQVAEMEDVEMAKIAEKIAAARDEGDLKENAEYHAQREEQGKLQAKIKSWVLGWRRAEIKELISSRNWNRTVEVLLSENLIARGRGYYYLTVVGMRVLSYGLVADDY